MLHFSAPSSMWASVNVKCVYVSVAGCHPTHSSVSLTRTHSPSFFFCAVSSLPCSFTWFRLIFIDYFLLVCECVCMCAWVCECVCVYFLAVNVNLWVSGGSYACLQTPRPIAARLHSFVLNMTVFELPVIFHHWSDTDKKYPSLRLAVIQTLLIQTFRLKGHSETKRSFI